MSDNHTPKRRISKVFVPHATGLDATLYRDTFGWESIENSQEAIELRLSERRHLRIEVGTRPVLRIPYAFVRVGVDGDGLSRMIAGRPFDVLTGLCATRGQFLGDALGSDTISCLLKDPHGIVWDVRTSYSLPDTKGQASSFIFLPVEDVAAAAQWYGQFLPLFFDLDDGDVTRTSVGHCVMYSLCGHHRGFFLFQRLKDEQQPLEEKTHHIPFFWEKISAFEINAQRAHRERIAGRVTTLPSLTCKEVEFSSSSHGRDHEERTGFDIEDPFGHHWYLFPCIPRPL